MYFKLFYILITSPILNFFGNIEIKLYFPFDISSVSLCYLYCGLICMSIKHILIHSRIFGYDGKVRVKVPKTDHVVLFLFSFLERPVIIGRVYDRRLYFRL